MKNPFILLISIGCIFSACQSGNENKKPKEDSLITESADPTVKNSPLMGDTLTDPDTTDTIPREAYDPSSYRQEAVEVAKAALKEMNKADLAKNLIDSASRKFTLFEIDLNDDQKNEIFVGLIGPYFCGSGGCTTLLLQSDGSLISRFTVTGYPIIIAKEKTRGWKNLILSSDGEYRLVNYDGKKYPGNPSVQPVYENKPADDLTRALDIERKAYPRFDY